MKTATLRPIAIVVPCYNEEQRLNVFAFHRFLIDSPRCRLVFVNDGSRDGTLEVLQRFQSASEPGWVEIVDLPCNCGKAEAVRQGVLTTLEQGAELIGFWDADLATPMDAVEDFVRVFDRTPEIEIVIGARIPLFGHAVERNARRNLIGKVFAWAASFVLGVRLQDTQCGAKMFRNSQVLKAILQRPFLSRWIFDVEILSRWKQAEAVGASNLKNCLYEIPLQAWKEVGGSKLRATDFLKAPMELWSIFWDSHREIPVEIRVAVSQESTRKGFAKNEAA